MKTNDDFHPGSRVNRPTAKAASSVKDGIDAASASADRAMNAASNKWSDVRDGAAPLVKQGIDQARGWADDQAGRVQAGVKSARAKADDLGEQLFDYVREEPVKSLLIAAAVGALVLSVLGSIARSDD